jgi:hypothetical protein
MVAPGKPVFPLQGKESLNVKEYFAAAALQGILAGPLSGGDQSPIKPDEAAKKAVEYADALLKAL